MRFFVLPIFDGVIASDILIVVDTSYTDIFYPKYWMPIYYDNIKGGQKSHLFSK